MPKIVKNGKEYSGVPIEVVTAWQPTGDPVQVAEPLMGNTDISDIGDGTITGAVSSLSAGLITFGTWNPIISDYGTTKTTLGDCPYFKIGKFYILIIPVTTLPTISIATMLQIRGCPCTEISGGQIYMGTYSGEGGNRTVQASQVGVYLRPNITGTISGSISGIFFGRDI